ncbi:MAG: recombinase family protein [Clostridiaceae bacterium]|nr:recombinase family protein [Clostridiaceae bacterium]
MNDLEVDEIYVDNASDKNTDRPELKEILQTVVVKAFNKVLNRKNTFLFILQGNIGFMSNKENYDKPMCYWQGILPSQKKE